MRRSLEHRQFCFAGQPAPCKGYFTGDELPCVCGVEGNVIRALSELSPPAPLIDTLTSRHRNYARPEPLSRICVQTTISEGPEKSHAIGTRGCDEQLGQRNSAYLALIS